MNLRKARVSEGRFTKAAEGEIVKMWNMGMGLKINDTVLVSLPRFIAQEDKGIRTWA